MNKLRIGTRSSALALWQTNHVAQQLKARHQNLEVELVHISTEGDRNLSDKLVGKLEKGFFTKELEAAIREGRIDCAVHSLKDLPTENPQGLAIAAVLERAAANDILIALKKAVNASASTKLPLRQGAKVGSSSVRREAMIRHFSQEACKAIPLRGNVPTRVEKLAAEQCDAIVLAHAGVARLNLPLEQFDVFVLNPHVWVPAPGQGSIAVQTRENDVETIEKLSPLDHKPSRLSTAIERDFLNILEGGCSAPFGCYSKDDCANLALQTAHGFRQLRVQTLLTGGKLDRTFAQSTLDELSSQTTLSRGENDDWLYRKL